MTVIPAQAMTKEFHRCIPATTGMTEQGLETPSTNPISQTS
jgi:hypothetical protein